MIKKIKTLFTVCVVGASLFSARADEDQFKSRTNWNAQWIGVKEASVPNQWICLRKSFNLTNTPAEAPVSISADSKYWLWINDELVVFEGQLKRGPNPTDTYYDQIDIAEYLRNGTNTIAVSLWYFGKGGFSHNSSGQAGFLFDALINGEKLISDTSWKAIVDPAHGNTKTANPNYRLPEPNIQFHVEKAFKNWQNPDFNDKNWPQAIAFGLPPVKPWNKLVKRPIPMWKDSGLVDYVNQSELPSVSDGTVIKAKLPYNAMVTAYLKIEAPGGKIIDIRTDCYDYMNKGKAPSVRAEYITKNGVQEYENLGWVNGHEVQYSIPAGIKIIALKYRETGYNTEFTGTFDCDDQFMNRFRKKALRTLYVTMRDNYMDCPDRERAQWWGDVVNEMGEAFYALDHKSSYLARKAINELYSWQREDGTIFSPIPMGRKKGHELPMQMLASVGYYGLWSYYQYTGDLETLRSVYPNVQRYLSLWEIGANGLVVQRKGGWLWGDWGKDKDMTILFNSWYYLALKGQYNMALTLNDTDEAAEIKKKMETIKENYNKIFWTGKEYRSPDYKDQTDDRGHALAVVSGLADKDKYDAIYEVFKNHEHSSPYMEKYVTEALCIIGQPEYAFERTKKRFKDMVEHSSTTLWEGWEIGSDTYGGGTVNHAWSGGTLTILSQYFAGVAPTTGGYETYQIMPQLGDLKRINTIVPSVKGDIILSITAGDTFNLTVNSPNGTLATVGIPASNGQTVADVSINGSSFAELKQHGKISYVGCDEKYIKFSVAPGKWEFSL